MAEHTCPFQVAEYTSALCRLKRYSYVLWQYGLNFIYLDYVYYEYVLIKYCSVLFGSDI